MTGESSSFDFRAIVLGVSALSALGVGLSLVANPNAFRASFGLETSEAASALSEIRAPGGALFALGVVMIRGVFDPRERRNGLLVAAATLLGYALARLVGFGVDGAPSGDLVLAASFEGTVGLAALLSLRTNEKQPVAGITGSRSVSS